MFADFAIWVHIYKSKYIHVYILGTYQIDLDFIFFTHRGVTT